MTTGLLLGKFMPPHRGHLRLLSEALAAVDELTVMVCSLAAEPIPGELRYAWMRELAPGARVVHVTDENPSLPEDDPEFWEKWLRTIRRVFPDPPDLLITGEAYGDELARRLGSIHLRIDRAPDGISATEVRADPMRWWDDIAPPARPWFARRVVLTGSESTGKTTLAARLAAHYGTVWVPEFGRTYVDALTRPLERADVDAIARGQLAREAEALPRANRLLILDTDVLSTAVYGEHYYGYAPEWLFAALRERPAHLYLLHDVDVPWVADPQRDRGHMRDEMHGLFRAAVEATGVPVVEIRGDWEDRFRLATEAIDAMSANGLASRRAAEENGESQR